MRKFIKFPILLLLLVLVIAGCKKHKAVNPIDELPPETQNGAGTFGCLVNGRAFKPGGASLSGGSLSSNYQFLGNGNDDFHFRLAAFDKNNGSAGNYSIGMATDSLRITEGTKYPLIGRKKGATFALYGHSKSNPLFFDDYETTDMVTGILHIKRFDEVNQIVSGTFWFNAINEKGDTVKVTDGRFDVRFTR